jgi:hypothetical protein
MNTDPPQYEEVLTGAETTPVVRLQHLALLVFLYEGPSTTSSTKIYEFDVVWWEGTNFLLYLD